MLRSRFLKARYQCRGRGGSVQAEIVQIVSLKPIQTQRSQLENRKLAIDLAALLVRWEERRIREARERAAANGGDDAGAAGAGNGAAAAGDGGVSPDRKRPREEEGEGAAADTAEPMATDPAAGKAGDGAAAAAAAAGAEPPAKQARASDGAAVPTASRPGGADGEPALSAQQADAVLHLLIRVAFVCADAPDREMQALRAYTLKVGLCHRRPV